MTSTSDPDAADTICPLTLKPLPSSDLDIGVTFDSISPFEESSGCGHRCTLDALVRYIEGEPAGSGNEKMNNTAGKGGAIVCPVCLAPIISVCDGIVASEKLREKADVVCFRYAKQNYWLSVPNRCGNASVWSSIFKLGLGASTAQGRVADVLGMSAKSGGLKILHKGRVIFPHAKDPADFISTQLVDLSKSCKGNKPSLVVMGTRSGKEVISAPGTASDSYRTGIFSLFSWGVTFLFNTTRAVLGGIFLFAKSLFILPDRQNERRDD